MSIIKYHELNKDKLSRTCSQHNDQQYSGGCRSCLKLVCAHCAFKPDSCDDGETLYIYISILYSGHMT